ncbi:type 1 glutamine amidotransferase [Methanoplanus sp. FWC-SCC4]|uniref:Type 1 glutamine amidotransferase n=1 Tax=Methanochimaera problematica TaxID=2609417 RepID=A0AA97FE35_9EURY|nr:type 1 glutamine amidotransferase [Methanoplanus sp. FWC-SCC4]WOF16534.1 type 1 glutamine amidotransferase [Methanoplanus sp. FWC-SCC4]
MKIHSLIHLPFEDTGCIRHWAQKKGYSFSETRLYDGQSLPILSDFDLLIVMGGTMNIYEEDKYPWLAEEKSFIMSAIDSEKKVIGICLGAQIIASVLGAKVTKNRKPEVGWFGVEMCCGKEDNALCSLLPERFLAFHWHGDTFEIPCGAEHLFKSPACDNQAFLYDERILGLQFHPEVTGVNVRNLVENCFYDIKEGFDSIQTAPEILGIDKTGPLNEVMYLILEYFEKL